MPQNQIRIPDLAGKTVVVTGGGSGIGACLARGFAAQDCRVAIIDIDADAGRQTTADIAASGHPEPFFIAADLTGAEALKDVFATIADRLGPVRVLVNNAARDDRHEFLSASVEDWDASQAINLRPAFFTAQAAMPMMKAAGGGSIINFSSIAFLINLGDLPAYCAAKAGLIGLTKSLAGRLGPDGIRVNAILPGMVLTERQKRLWIDQSAIDAMIARQCLKFSIMPEDLVGPALFLASDMSHAMTSQTIIIDGGCL